MSIRFISFNTNSLYTTSHSSLVCHHQVTVEFTFGAQNKRYWQLYFPQMLKHWRLSSIWNTWWKGERRLNGLELDSRFQFIHASNQLSMKRSTDLWNASLKPTCCYCPSPSAKTPLQWFYSHVIPVILPVFRKLAFLQWPHIIELKIPCVTNITSGESVCVCVLYNHALTCLRHSTGLHL